MKVAQRFIAVILIFIIWILVFQFTAFLKRDGTLTQIDCPESTLGIVKVNSRTIFSKILFDYAFRNKDAKMMKTVSEYYQNWAQDTRKRKFPIDFSENFALIKIQTKGEIFWLIAGKATNEGTKPHGIIRKGIYYEFIGSEVSKTKSMYKVITQGSWFTSNIDQTKALSYELIQKTKVMNRYDFHLNQGDLVITYKKQGRTSALLTDSTRNFFHLTTKLNKGSFLPDKYKDLKVLTDKLESFSLTYFGAIYIDDEYRASHVDPSFDLLLNFSQKTKIEELTQLLRKVAKEDVRIEGNYIFLNNARYRLKAINDSMIFIGKNNPECFKATGHFSMKGKPRVLTEIQNLGWKGGLLELIPEYQALKDFSQSVAEIDMNIVCNKEHSTGNEQCKCVKNQQQITISFKPGTNARLETFRVLLTMANAYQFEQ